MSTPVIGQKPTYIQVSLVCLISVAVYLNTLWNGFVYDDAAQVLHNTWIRDAGNIPAIFRNNVWAFMGKESNYYRPVMHLIYMLSYHIFGFAPWGFHLVDILLNMAVCILVFGVTGGLLRDYGADAVSMSYVPLLTAAVFAVHPVHTESVAWVASVPDLSYTLFYLLSFYFYMSYRRGGEGSVRALVLSVSSFFVAMLCKEPAVTLPGILLVYDYAVKRSHDGPAGYLKRYSPYALAIAVYFLIRVSALGGLSPGSLGWKFGPYLFAVNIIILLGRYIEMLLFPLGLNVSHPFHPAISLSGLEALTSVALAAGFLAALFFSLRKRSMSAMGLVLAVLPLLPALYIPGAGRDIFSERYLYLPVFGFALLLALYCARISERLPSFRKTLAVPLVALILVYSAGTVAGNAVWADDITLWTHSVKLAPDNSSSRNSLGDAYYHGGLVDKAIDEYRAAIRLDNENMDAHAGLAVAYASKGMLEGAIEESRIVLSRGKVSGYELARAHSNLGGFYAQQGQMEKAIIELDQAIKLNPMLPEAHGLLGAAYAGKGRLDEAEMELSRAIELDPMLPDPHYMLGVVYMNKGRFDKAVDQLAQSVKLNPMIPEAHSSLGIAYAKMGRPDMAVREFEEALKLDPGDQALRENLRRAYEQMQGGRPEGAVTGAP